MSTITHAETNLEILRCFPVMHQLRPHLTQDEFLRRVLLQHAQGFRLAFLEDDHQICAVAGYRLLDNLIYGHFLYVDDLVTCSKRRSCGHGAALFSWLKKRATQEGCAALHLDSGVQRFGAHRFYLKERMEITCHHFGITIETAKVI